MAGREKEKESTGKGKGERGGVERLMVMRVGEGVAI